MSTTTPATEAPAAKVNPFCLFERYLKPLLTPYYITVAAVVGIISVIFGVITILLIIVATNFNVLGWME